MQLNSKTRRTIEFWIPILRRTAHKSNLTSKHASVILIPNEEQLLYPQANCAFNKCIKTANINNTYPHKYTIHAEIAALSTVKYPLKGTDILIIRVNKSNQLVMSRPCNQCIDMLCKVGIRNVYYSDIHGNIVKEQAVCMEKTHVCSGKKYLLRIQT